jgi:beta-galactosidase
MRYLFIIACMLTTLFGGVAAAAPGRERVSLDHGWRFHLGDAADVGRDFDFGRGMPFAKAGQAIGAARPDFDDSAWEDVDIPHDWVVELDFDGQGDALHMYHGYKPVSRTKPATTIGWYRRAFDLPRSDEGRRLSIEFDGVFRDSIAWLNGHFLGRHMSGYSSFAYDITDCANYGGRNVLVVRVDASHYEGWFYEGAGIYRHVRLVKTNPLHVARWGTFVTSVVKGNQATLTVRTTVANDSENAAPCQVISTVLDADGKAVAATQSRTMKIEPWAEVESAQEVKITNPRLWSIETPHMYRLVTIIKSGATSVDTYETPFGIRTIRFDPNQGFFLNGKRVEIKGVCCHQDHAGVGSALPDRIQYYRIEKLKEMGCNAYRTSHNAPTPELLDACDRLGMLVMDEQRMIGSSEEILGQLARMVLRDRNHPSVILWSLGNEEDAIQGTDAGARIAATMKRTVERLDPTRPVTVAMNGSWGRGFSHVVDVQGCNYMSSGDIDAYHKSHPNQPMIGTEEASTLCTRGIYANDPTRGYMSAYDAGAPPWGSTAEKFWQFYAARPFLAGGFVWTGFDYRGEPTPYAWPCISSHFGIMDTCGFPKDNYYYYQAWWSDRPVLHLLPHWNWPGKEGQEIAVWCHSNCDEVELLLNGRSLGRKEMPRNSHLEWKVPYAPGVLEARGFKGGRVVATTKVETTGPAAKVALAPDRSRISADGEDVSLMTVSITDAQGRVVPTADNEVSFKVSGGRIIGVGNGDPSSHEADKASRRKAFNGLCMVIVQSSTDAGPIRLTATSPGIEPATAVIQAARGTR